MLLCGALLGGCAGGLRDGHYTTQIRAEPSVVNCKLSGNGYRNRLNTPAHLPLPKAAALITLTCDANGYQTPHTRI